MPDNDAWRNLNQIAGGANVNASVTLRTTTDWCYDGLCGNGTDEFGFSALPGGMGSFGGIVYVNAGSIGYWWSSTEAVNKDYPYSLYIDRYNDQAVVLDGTFIYGYDKSATLSVRCVQK